MDIWLLVAPNLIAFAFGWWLRGRRAHKLVTNHMNGDVTVVSLVGERIRSVTVNEQPIEVVSMPDGNQMYVTPPTPTEAQVFHRPT